MTAATGSIAKLAQRLRRGDTVFTAWTGLPDPELAGLLARQPYDAVTLDMQHGPVTLKDAISAISRIAVADKPSVVRIPVGEFQTASRLLDAGASAIIAPMINTVDDATRLAAHVKFPALGARSWGAYGAQTAAGFDPTDYLATANGFSLAFAMIETREALAIIDDLLALEGIDGVFIGPADLSIALSDGRVVDPDTSEVQEAVCHVIARAAASGKPVGYYARDAARARAAAALGCRFIAPGNAESLLVTASQAALSAARGGG